MGRLERLEDNVVVPTHVGDRELARPDFAEKLGKASQLAQALPFGPAVR